MKILNVNNQDVLSGELYVIVSPGEGYRPNNSYAGELEVDGKMLGGTSVQSQEDGSRAMAFWLPTNHYTNGPHTLRVTDRQGNVDVRQAQFRNTIHQVSPDGPFDLNPDAEDIPHSAQITATVWPPQPWRAEIASIDGVVVRVFTGVGDRINVVWDGTDDQGKLVEDASYLVTFSTPALSSQCMSLVSKVSM